MTYTKNTSSAMSTNDLRKRVKTILISNIERQIHCDLTVGMDDNDKKPWSYHDIIEFLLQYQARVQKVADVIIEAYEADNELEQLLEPEAEWIREFLYDNFPEIPNYND